MITDAEYMAIKAFDRTLARNADEAQRIINQKNRELFALQGMISELKASLLQERSANAGLSAQVQTFAATHPDSPLLKPTGRVYENGRKQTAVSPVFDAAFDKKAIELGHKDPKSMRFAVVDNPSPRAGPRR